MPDKLSDIEKNVHNEDLDYKPVQYVMEDAVIGKIKPAKDIHVSDSSRLELAMKLAVATLIAIPLTSIVSFHDNAKTAAAVRLALLAPVIFVMWIIVLFGSLWLLQRWFSQWFVMLVAGIGFVGAGLYALGIV